MSEDKFKELEARLDFLEFRQDLLFNNSTVDRLLYEYKITQNQYRTIMDLMDEYRAMLGEGQDVGNSLFEDKVYEIVPEHAGNYHFCEYITRAFMEEGRWEEVFPALYGDMPKYQFLKNKNRD